MEILGVLKNSLGPGRDMILARLHGQKPEYTGVVAGMSGSPVYIDGRLVGALSYRIGQFSKEPIAGITPIESMLEVRDEGAGGTAAVNVPRRSGEERFARSANAHVAESGAWGTRDCGGSGGDAGDGDSAGVWRVQPGGGGAVWRQVSRDGADACGGLGGADAAAVQPEPLVPGSAVSAILVRGDLSMAGTCTVTYVDPTRLLACGHPIYAVWAGGYADDQG